MHVVVLGPWAIPVGIIAILIGWLAASAVAAFLRHRGHGDAAPVLWWLLLTALAAARIGYVVRWWSEYQQSSWWTILDIRDLGFDPVVGGSVLALAIALVAWRRPRLRRSLPGAAVGGLALAGLTVLVAFQLQAGAHPPLSNSVLHRMDGAPTTLAAFKGKPMVINLWATWCGPCRSEMPMLVQASHATRGVRFLFVDQGEPAATVATFLARERLAPRHVLLDANGLLARDYRAPGFPTTLFVDAEGRLRNLRVGPLSRATLAQYLQGITSTTTQDPVAQ